MTPPSLTDRVSAAGQTLDPIGQGHVLHFIDKLNEAELDHLLAQIETIDWQEVGRLIESHVKAKPKFQLPDHIEPASSYPHTPTADLKKKYKEARALGQEMIRQGKVAAFTVAGGQGTRLGWPGPKGTYPATPIQKLPLFACLAQYLRKVEPKYSHACRWYIMTSPANDAATRDYFNEHGFFGLEPSDVMFFPQAMMPAIDIDTAKVLLESPVSLSLSPNGHGGSLKALHTSGALGDMKQHGIEQISYTQIDNPLVKVIDPLFLGLHAADGCQMSSKMLPKAYPKEKLGNFCTVNDRVTVIEYSDLPDELAQQRLPNGGLRFRAGSIAIHAMQVSFVESLNTTGQGFGLPYHRAEKKMAYVDLDSGDTVTPTKPNAVKLETFVFDALPRCEHSIVLETQRVEEFAPIKNAEGVDSAQTSAQLQTERAARWLESRGVKVSRKDNGDVDGVIEISHLTAIEPDDLDPSTLPKTIEPGTEVLL